MASWFSFSWFRPWPRRSSAWACVGAWLRVELAGPAPARLTMVDIRGRVLEARAVDASGVVELAPSRTLSPGVYLVRIEQAGKVATARAVVL